MKLLNIQQSFIVRLRFNAICIFVLVQINYEFCQPKFNFTFIFWFNAFKNISKCYHLIIVYDI